MSRVLYIGNKNRSSWSLRAWLALKEKGVAFEERLVDLGDPSRAVELAQIAPSAQVPALVDEGNVIFDSLAIMEYANDAFDGPALLPSDKIERGQARSFMAWMHSGFVELRKGMPFEGTFHKNPVAAPDVALREAAGLSESWERQLEQSDGPYLFAELSLADLVFVPVIRRLKAHGFPLSRYPRVALWSTELMSRASVREWMAAAEALTPVGR